MAAALVGALAACSSGSTDATNIPPRRIDCDPARHPCSADTSLGRVGLEVSPRPIPVMRPMDIVVSAGGAEEVSVEFSGQDMDMGPNRTRLLRRDDGRWQGSATLPVCVSGRMRWNLVLHLQRGTSRESLVLGFEAGGQSPQ